MQSFDIMYWAPLQVLSALAGSPTTFLHPPGKPVTDHPNVAGAEAALVALVQVEPSALHML